MNLQIPVTKKLRKEINKYIYIYILTCMHTFFMNEFNGCNNLCGVELGLFERQASQLQERGQYNRRENPKKSKQIDKIEKIEKSKKIEKNRKN